MRSWGKVFLFTAFCFLVTICLVHAQANIYDLRKLTDDEWQAMTTEEHLQALSVSNNHARNQTWVGNFGRDQDLYAKWGYDYYEMEDRYENYAFRGFENYNIIEDRRQRWYYNSFGDRLTKMSSSAGIWQEVMNDDGTTSSSSPWSYVNSQLGGRGTTQGIDGVWVARESTDDWAVSLVGAGALRAKLTPLTLSMPNRNGMKADFQSANYAASMVNYSMDSHNSNEIMLRGFQFRRKFGALTLGTTLSNLYGNQRNRDEGNDFRGTVTDYAPTPIMYAIRIVDDSPHDGGGPIVHDVKLKVNGR